MLVKVTLVLINNTAVRSLVPEALVGQIINNLQIMEVTLALIGECRQKGSCVVEDWNGVII